MKKVKNILKESGLRAVDENKILFADLRDLGLILIGTLKHMFVKPLYINEESDKYINIDNFDKVVTYYDEYKNGVKYKTCKICGKRFKDKKYSPSKYCQKCARQVKLENDRMRNK